MSLKEFSRNRWTRFVFWALLYTAWVIWLGNFWWLFGLAVIFDACVTKKVHWNFWKKRYKEGEKPDSVNEWLDAIIFAVIVVTFINIFFIQAFKIPSSSMERTLYTGDHLFVSKLTYGPRIPETPLTIPFTHNTIFGKESYSTLIKSDYRRLKGFREVRKGDCVVFGFPHGDTVLRKAPAEDYYTYCRFYGREATIAALGPIVVRPSDKVDHYVKRCVATPGDTLSVHKGLVWVNGEQQRVYKGIQFSKHFETVQQDYREIFPFDERYTWSRDEFGPLWIPQKGVTIPLDENNLPLYERIISVYEKGSVQKALEDGQYTFKQDYYFMMGDNRHNSLDSRYWGFVPEDHIVGRPVIVWLSTDNGKRFPQNIRWGRFLKIVRN
ncbi:MAG: signal peptidase I [Bacteroidales bacterium]|nr:signal peptidase I [Bacteroidales bacterium]